MSLNRYIEVNITTDFEDMNFVVKQLESFVRLLSGESLFAQQTDKEADVLVKWSHRVDIRKYRYYFRGEPSCDYKLLPKISRQDCNLFDRENIIRRLCKNSSVRHIDAFIAIKLKFLQNSH